MLKGIINLNNPMPSAHNDWFIGGLTLSYPKRNF